MILSQSIIGCDVVIHCASNTVVHEARGDHTGSFIPLKLSITSISSPPDDRCGEFLHPDHTPGYTSAYPSPFVSG